MRRRGMSWPRRPSVVPPYAGSAETYQQLLGRPMLRRFLSNFRYLLRRYAIPCRSVADVGCGTGAFLRQLRRDGFDVVGVDRSEEMVRIARSATPDGAIDFFRQDVRDLNLPAPVDVVTCNFDVLNYLLRPTDLVRAFTSIRRNLVRGGYLLFDMITQVAGNDPDRQINVIARPDGRSVWSVDIDPERGTRSVTIRHERRRRAPTWEFHHQRAYPEACVVSLLERSGFHIRGLHDTASIGSRARRGPRVTFVARRSE